MQTVTYKHTSQGELKMHVFEPAGDAAATLRAGIVFFFGGGWRNGNPQQFFPHAEHLASLGMVAASAEYRVADVHGTTPFECVSDGKSAVRWLRQHASEFGLDAGRLAAGGGSAGGHVAAATACVEGFEDPDEDAGACSKPDALVLFNPVIDTGPEGFGQKVLGKKGADISPLHRVRSGLPPAVLFLGDRDPILPVSLAERFRDSMVTAGNRCEIHVYEGQAHGFFNFRDGTNPYYEQTVNEMDAFLRSVAYLEA